MLAVRANAGQGFGGLGTSDRGPDGKDTVRAETTPSTQIAQLDATLFR